MNLLTDIKLVNSLWCHKVWAFQVLVVKNLPVSAGDIIDVSLIPGSGRSPGGEHGNLPQYSSLENSMDRGAPQAAVHGVPESQTGTQHKLSEHGLGALTLQPPDFWASSHLNSRWARLCLTSSFWK